MKEGVHARGAVVCDAPEGAPEGVQVDNRGRVREGSRGGELFVRCAALVASEPGAADDGVVLIVGGLLPCVELDSSQCATERTIDARSVTNCEQRHAAVSRDWTSSTERPFRDFIKLLKDRPRLVKRNRLTWPPSNERTIHHYGGTRWLEVTRPAAALIRLRRRMAEAGPWQWFGATRAPGSGREIS